MMQPRHDTVMMRIKAGALLVALGGLCGCSTQTAQLGVATAIQPAAPERAAKPPCCEMDADAEAQSAEGEPVRGAAAIALGRSTPVIPDAELLDQYGQPVKFYSDLVRGRSVAIMFFFTSCTTICPPLTATMTQVQTLLKERGRDDIQIISISVDPVTDTPARLRSWSKNFKAQEGWRFLTGEKTTVDNLLKALKSFTPDPQDHSPMILVGNEPEGVWKQVYGLASATDLARAICNVAGPRPESQIAPTTAASSTNASSDAESRDQEDHARSYFTDVELVDQNGVPHRLYSDLMKGRVVVISSFFASCTGVCPVLNQKLTAIRQAFPERMGVDLFLLSISVDPLVDTPARLKEYAESLQAGKDWYFLTGDKENVDFALQKLGMYVESRESHSNIFLVGNLRTGLWKKAFGLAPPGELASLVEGVLNDDERTHE